MTHEHPIAADAPAMPSARRRLMDLIQHVTGCDRSTAGSVVADTIHMGRFTAEAVALYEQAQAQAQAQGDTAPCPRCMGPRPHGTSGICCDCRQAMAERARARDAGRAPKEIRLAGLPEPTTPLPEPTEPHATVLDRFEIEDFKRMCAGKNRYPSAIDAEKTKARCERDRPWTKLRVYHCEACLGWHLTRLAKAPDHLRAP